MYFFFKFLILKKLFFLNEIFCEDFTRIELLEHSGISEFKKIKLTDIHKLVYYRLIRSITPSTSLNYD